MVSPTSNLVLARTRLDLRPREHLERYAILFFHPARSRWTPFAPRVARDCATSAHVWKRAFPESGASRTAPSPTAGKQSWSCDRPYEKAAAMKVLIVEDETVVARRVEQFCRRILGNQLTNIRRLETFEAAQATLAENPIDLLLLDLNL